jgi:hypothetical protein
VTNEGNTVTEYVHVEPGHEHRRAFARWGLKQSPRLETASASGWDVPLDLYPSVPSELLTGATVDGYPYGVPQPQPQPKAAPEAVRAPVARQQRRPRNQPRKAVGK